MSAVVRLAVAAALLTGGFLSVSQSHALEIIEVPTSALAAACALQPVTEGVALGRLIACRGVDRNLYVVPDLSYDEQGLTLQAAETINRFCYRTVAVLPAAMQAQHRSGRDINVDNIRCR